MKAWILIAVALAAPATAAAADPPAPPPAAPSPASDDALLSGPPWAGPHAPPGTAMTPAQRQRFEAGKAVLRKVYGPRVPIPADAEFQPYWQLMMGNLFADVWGRETMSIRDRRLVIIGAIAAIADSSLIEIQLKAALDKDELKREQLREIPLILNQYIGIPRTVPVARAVEKVLETYTPPKEVSNAETQRR